MKARQLLFVPTSIAVLVVAPSAFAGQASFSLTPVPIGGMMPDSTSYFVLDSRPGRTIVEHAKLTNSGSATGIVRIYSVDAVTGRTSGAVYRGRRARTARCGRLDLDAHEVDQAPTRAVAASFGFLSAFHAVPGPVTTSAAWSPKAAALARRGTSGESRSSSRACSTPVDRGGPRTPARRCLQRCDRRCRPGRPERAAISQRPPQEHARASDEGLRSPGDSYRLRPPGSAADVRARHARAENRDCVPGSLAACARGRPISRHRLARCVLRRSPDRHFPGLRARRGFPRSPQNHEDVRVFGLAVTARAGGIGGISALPLCLARAVCR